MHIVIFYNWDVLETKTFLILPSHWVLAVLLATMHYSTMYKTLRI